MSDLIIYVPVRCIGNARYDDRDSHLRLDHISEIHPLLTSSAPYTMRGSRVHLTTGREIEVADTPIQLLERMNDYWQRAMGIFNSERDGLAEDKSG